DHVVVADGGGRPGLPHEPLPGGGAGGQGGVEDLEGDDPVQLVVERPQDDPEPAAADDLQHLVVPQPAERARLGGRRQEVERVRVAGGEVLGGGPVEDRVRAVVGRQQRVEPPAEGGVGGAGVVQEHRPLGRGRPLQGGQEQLQDAVRLVGHGRTSGGGY